MNPEAIKELMVKLGFDYEDSGGREFIDASKDIRNSIFGVISAMVASIGAVSTFAIVTSKGAEEQINLAKALGLSERELRAYQDAADRAGMDSGALVGKLQDIQKELALVASGQESKLFSQLARLNISAFNEDGSLKDAKVILQEILTNLSKIQDLNTRRGFTEMLLGDFAQWNELVTKGGKQIEQSLNFLNRMKYGLTGEEAKSVEEFRDAWTETSSIISQVYTKLSALTSKAMKPLLEAFNEWYIANEKIINQDMAKVIEDLLMVMKQIAPLFKVIGDALMKSVEGWAEVFRWIEYFDMRMGAGGMKPGFIPGMENIPSKRPWDYNPNQAYDNKGRPTANNNVTINIDTDNPQLAYNVIDRYGGNYTNSLGFHNSEIG
jgi:hypothetical protein